MNKSFLLCLCIFMLFFSCMDKKYVKYKKNKLQDKELFSLYNSKIVDKKCSFIDDIYIRILPSSRLSSLPNNVRYGINKFHDNGQITSTRAILEYPTQDTINNFYESKEWQNQTYIKYYCIENDSIKIESVLLRPFEIINIINHGIIRNDSIIIKYTTRNGSMTHTDTSVYIKDNTQLKMDTIFLKQKRNPFS